MTTYSVTISTTTQRVEQPSYQGEKSLHRDYLMNTVFYRYFLIELISYTFVNTMPIIICFSYNIFQDYVCLKCYGTYIEFGINTNFHGVTSVSVTSHAS